MSIETIPELINQADGFFFIENDILKLIKKEAAKISTPVGHRILRTTVKCPHCIDGNIYSNSTIRDCEYCSGTAYRHNDELVKAYQLDGKEFFLPAERGRLPENFTIEIINTSDVFPNKDKFVAIKAMYLLGLLLGKDKVIESLMNTLPGELVWKDDHKSIIKKYKVLIGEAA